MRAGALFIAIVGGWLIVGAGHLFAAPSQNVVAVADVASSRRAFNGQRLRIKGVMIGGWKVCSQPLQPNGGHSANYGAAHCIDLRAQAPDDPFETHAEKYHGAEVVIDGIYWNRCLPEVQAGEPAYIREICEYTPNGYLGPLGVRIIGYVALHEPAAASDLSLREVELGSPEAAGIDTFVKVFTAAVAARDVNALLALFDIRERGQRRVWFKAPTSREFWVYLAQEMAPRVDVAVPRAGYRLYVADPSPAGHLCFCRTSSCEGRWPRWAREITETQSIKTPTVCFSVRQAGGRWLFD